jgi:hypothetical protein
MRSNLLLVLLALLTFCIQAARAADEIHEGKVVVVGESTITVLDKRDGDQDTFVVTVQTKITKNGKSVKLSEIQAGDAVKVTASAVEMDGKLVAKEIMAIAAM